MKDEVHGFVRGAAASDVHELAGPIDRNDGCPVQCRDLRVEGLERRNLRHGCLDDAQADDAPAQKLDESLYLGHLRHGAHPATGNGGCRRS